MGSLRVGHNWVTLLSLFTFMHWRRKWQPTPVFLPGESQDGGAWWADVYGVAWSRTWLKWLSSSHCINPVSSVHTLLEFIVAIKNYQIVAWKVKVSQSCLILCSPVDCSLPGSSGHEILQARILEWVAISFSRGSSKPRNQTRTSCMADRFFTVRATRCLC